MRKPKPRDRKGLGGLQSQLVTHSPVSLTIHLNHEAHLLSEQDEKPPGEEVKEKITLPRPAASSEGRDRRKIRLLHEGCTPEDACPPTVPEHPCSRLQVGATDA